MIVRRDVGLMRCVVACVPVGLTRYREGLYPLEPFDAEKAGAAIDILERWGEKFLAAPPALFDPPPIDPAAGAPTV